MQVPSKTQNRLFDCGPVRLASGLLRMTLVFFLFTTGVY